MIFSLLNQFTLKQCHAIAPKFVGCNILGIRFCRDIAGVRSATCYARLSGLYHDGNPLRPIWSLEQIARQILCEAVQNTHQFG